MKEYFKGIPQIRYEGPDSKNPLAFKQYDPDQQVGKKTMAEHLRFSVVFWHTFKGTGADPFGGPVYDRPWDPSLRPDAAGRGHDAGGVRNVHQARSCRSTPGTTATSRRKPTPSPRPTSGSTASVHWQGSCSATPG